MQEVSRLESLAEMLRSSLRDAEHCNRVLEITVAELKQALEELQQQLDTVVSDPIAS
jgi:hypothetical protein